MELELIDEKTGKRASPEQVAEIKVNLLRALVKLRTEDCKLAALRIRLAVIAADAERYLEGLGIDVHAAPPKKAEGKVETVAQLLDKLLVQ